VTSEGQRAQQPVEHIGTRRVQGHDGRWWTVEELRESGYDRRAATSLVFWTDEVMRRLRQFPAEWQNLSDADLLALADLA
jgi:hypothetical protein